MNTVTLLALGPGFRPIIIITTGILARMIGGMLFGVSDLLLLLWTVIYGTIIHDSTYIYYYCNLPR